MFKAFAKVSLLAFCAAVFGAACTPLDKSGGPEYEKDEQGRDTYKGEDVSKYHRHSKLEKTSDSGKDAQGCPLPPPYDKEIIDKLKVGEPCPDFTLKDVTTGAEVKRSTHARGHYQIIVIWASWCPACKRMQEEALKPIYDEFGQGDKARIDVIAVGVNYLGDTAEAQKAYVNTNKFGWTCVFDKDAGVVNDFGSNSIPTAILVDDKGNVVTYGYYLDEYAKRLNKFLREACEFKEKNK